MSLAPKEIKINHAAKTLEQEIKSLAGILDDETLDHVASIIKFSQGKFHKPIYSRIGTGDNNHRQTLVAMIKLLTRFFPGQEDLTAAWRQAASINPVESRGNIKTISVPLQIQLSLVMEITGPKTTLSLIRSGEEN